MCSVPWFPVWCLPCPADIVWFDSQAEAARLEAERKRLEAEKAAREEAERRAKAAADKKVCVPVLRIELRWLRVSKVLIAHGSCASHRLFGAADGDRRRMTRLPLLLLPRPRPKPNRRCGLFHF